MTDEDKFTREVHTDQMLESKYGYVTGRRYHVKSGLYFYTGTLTHVDSAILILRDVVQVLETGELKEYVAKDFNGTTQEALTGCEVVIERTSVASAWMRKA
jgi:hypothetical protein